MRHAAVLAPSLLAILVAACGASVGAATEAGAPAAAAGNDPTCDRVLTPDELAGISTVDGYQPEGASVGPAGPGAPGVPGGRPNSAGSHW